MKFFFNHATVGGGYKNKAFSSYSAVGGGSENNATANYATNAGGRNNSVSSLYSANGGGYNQYVYLLAQSNSGGYNATSSKARQNTSITFQADTSNDTPTEMFLDSSTNRAVLKNNQSWAFDIVISCHSQTNIGDCARFKRSGLIKNVGGTVSLEGTVDTIGTDKVSTGLSGISIAITADDANNSLKLEVTGLASNTIVWQASCRLVEIEI